MERTRNRHASHSTASSRKLIMIMTSTICNPKTATSNPNSKSICTFFAKTFAPQTTWRVHKCQKWVVISRNNILEKNNVKKCYEELICKSQLCWVGIGRNSTMSDFHDFGLTWKCQKYSHVVARLPQRLKSTLFEIFSNGRYTSPSGTLNSKKFHDGVYWGLNQGCASKNKLLRSVETFRLDRIWPKQNNNKTQAKIQEFAKIETKKIQNIRDLRYRQFCIRIESCWHILQIFSQETKMRTKMTLQRRRILRTYK